MARQTHQLLPLGEGDETLNADQLQQLELFRSLGAKIKPEAIPGSVRLRRIPAGRIVVRQGDSGFTAFHIVPWSDILRLRLRQLAVVDLKANRRQAEIWHAEMNQLQADLPDASTPAFAAHFMSSRLPASRQRGWWTSRSADSLRRTRSATIRNDGPVDIDLGTGEADMFEGEIFGEMTCMTQRPRAATVIARRDCYVLEMVNWVFSKMQRDQGYKRRIEDLYRQRVLSSHMRKISIFEGAPLELLQHAGRRAELEVYEPGAVICEEGGPSDSVYLVKLGLAQVIRGVASTLKPDDVSNWPTLCRQLIDRKKAAEALAAEEAKAAERAKPASAPANKPSAADLLAQAKNKPKTATAADVLAQARAKKNPLAEESAATPPTKPSAADLLAQARAKKNPPAEEGAAAPPTKPTAADLLAQARAQAPPASAASAKPSAADILAQAKAKKAQSAPPEFLRMTADDVLSSIRTSAMEGYGLGPSEEVAERSAPLIAEHKLSAPTSSPYAYLWDCLGPGAQTSVSNIASGQASAADRQRVADALTLLMRNRKFVSSPCFDEPVGKSPGWRRIESYNESSNLDRLMEGAKGLWTETQVREAGRIVLESLFADAIEERNRVMTPPRILAYLNRGDCFGEMGVLLSQARSATCVAYDHPPNERAKRPGRVEVIRIPAEDFRELVDLVPEVRQRLQQLSDQRSGQNQLSQVEATELIGNRDYRDLGLFQGQNLLLIDLDKCTRCGDCVRACVATHDDGRSRLHLDGPRFERFLIPSACRQCLDPACLRECPVTAIFLGDEGQIEIADHCIGCRQCYSNCPYGSIQMHDTGVIPTRDAGWRVAAASDQPIRRPPRNSVAVETPLPWSLDTSELVRRLAADSSREMSSNGAAVPFPIEFWRRLARRDVSHRRHTLAVETPAEEARVWINGQPLSLSRDAKKQTWSAVIEPAKMLGRSSWIRTVIGPIPKAQFGDWLFSLRLDVHPQTDDEKESEQVELITEQAVVCDLCSSMPAQIPACVHQCPHDAAIRILPGLGQRIPL